jgi:sigma-B regulation protein RsbU (phosphoserine phosphatase)
MNSRLLQLRIWLEKNGVYPRSKLSIVTCFLLALDLVVFLVRQLSQVLDKSFGSYLSGWIGFLSAVVIVCLLVLAGRRVSAGLLWRLRNRLIVTYIFIGVIPLLLLITLFLGAFYLFAGQFATFVVTSRLTSVTKVLDGNLQVLAGSVAANLNAGRKPDSFSAQAGYPGSSQFSAWLDRDLLFTSPGSQPAIEVPRSVPDGFAGLARDRNRVFLRALREIPTSQGQLTVLASSPLDERLLAGVSTELGEIASGDLEPGTQRLIPKFSAGSIPPPSRALDIQVSFGTHLPTINWADGRPGDPVGIGGAARMSKLYDRLFSALGDVGSTMEVLLLAIAVVLGVFEAVAAYIGTQLTRTVTGSVAQLYLATTFVNRGDFSHRIPIASNDQLATLAASFNLMTESIEKLVLEQKEKQRLQNEITIAQEVQNQLFPQRVSKLSNLEVHGFCRPARSVSGDYYDFLSLGSDRLILAVGDVSGKGISAALLMATIHSAVRAYAMEGIPVFRQAEAVGAGGFLSAKYESLLSGAEVSPSTMLTLLNHQLYRSTPQEKYATLFLALYDAEARRLTYSNAGHLPPLLLGEDGSCCRLERGGTVVGLFDEIPYGEGTVQLKDGDILLAYSDGVTEPENEFGEFGADRLVALVQENRERPLPRISEIVTAAVDDWIGAAEQPDDVTLVLARVG